MYRYINKRVETTVLRIRMFYTRMQIRMFYSGSENFLIPVPDPVKQIRDPVKSTGSPTLTNGNTDKRQH
jgi:hypothetical protein